MWNEPNYIRPTDYFVMVKQIRGEWIPNFEEGKIYSTAINGYLTPSVDNNGYAYVKVTMMPGLRRQIYLHRALLVMKTGLPVDPRLEVDHINHNPGDNRVSNLRWATVSENTRNRPEKFATAEKIRREHEAGVPVRELAEKYAYSVRMIRNIIACERYNPAKYPGDTVKPRLHYSLPTSTRAFMGWYK